MDVPLFKNGPKTALTHPHPSIFVADCFESCKVSLPTTLLLCQQAVVSKWAMRTRFSLLHVVKEIRWICVHMYMYIYMLIFIQLCFRKFAHVCSIPGARLVVVVHIDLIRSAAKIDAHPYTFRLVDAKVFVRR